MKAGTALAVLPGLTVWGLLTLSASASGQTTEIFVTKTYDESVTVTYDSAANVAVNKTVSVTKDVNYVGSVVISGAIGVGSAGLSLVDNTQIIDDNFVDILGSDATLTNIAVIDGMALHSASGNIALNSAVGDAILQENVGNLAAIGTVMAAAADAEVFSVQKSIANAFDDGTDNAEVLNQAQLLGGVLGAASGNVGMNIAAGAFAAQKNAIALSAVAGTAILSESTAAVLQQVAFNTTFHNRTTNNVRLGDAVAQGFTGNIGINLSAGTNNVQLNTIIIASAP